MQPKKHYFAHIPTIAIFIVFAMSAPLGVLLFILKSIDPTSAPHLRRRPPSRKTSQPTALTAPPQNRRALKTGTRPLP